MRVGRVPSDEDINWVHASIENCIQKYMNKNETMHILDVHLNIDPNFTLIVWEQLEMDNPEFFKAYYTSLLLKDQIEEFNKLIWKQGELMHQYQKILTEVNGGPYCHISPGSTQQISTLSSAQNGGEYMFLQQQQQQQQSMFSDALNGGEYMILQPQQHSMFSDDGSSSSSSLQVTSDWFEYNYENGDPPNMAS